MDGDSSEILHQYRACGKVSPGSRPNVLYDTVNAYTGKLNGSNTVYYSFLSIFINNSITVIVTFNVLHVKIGILLITA